MINNPEIYFFYFFATIIVGSALFLLITKNVVYAAFALLSTLLGVAGLFVLASADFLGIMQIVIYIGGVLLLFMFAIMFANKLTGQHYIITEHKNLLSGVIIGIAVFIIFATAILNAGYKEHLSYYPNKSTISGIGIELMTAYVLPFEFAGVFLFAALIGSSIVAGHLIKDKIKK